MGISSLYKRNSAGSTKPLKRAFRISLFAVVLLWSHAAIAQQKQSAQNLTKPADFKRIYLKINPFTILTGPIPNTSEYRIGAEIVGTENLTYQFSGSLLTKSVLLSALVEDSVRATLNAYHFPGYRIQAQVRYYISKFKSSKQLQDAWNPSGLYMALHGSYAVASFKQKHATLPRQDWSNVAINALLGVQVISKESFGLDLFTGLGYKDHRAYQIDYRNRTTRIDLVDLYPNGLGTYMASPIKFSLGFHLTFGLL